MKARKKISLFLSFLLVFNLIFNNWRMIVKAEEPVSTLVLNSILVDKQTVFAGDKVNVTLDAADDVNGISQISVQYKLPSGSTTEAQLSLTDGKYTGTVDVGSSDNIIGDWKANEIKVTDNNGTQKEIFNNEIYSDTSLNLKDLSAGDFKVNEAVTFNSISVDKSSAAVGENVTVTLDIADQVNGISSASLFYKLPSGTDTELSLTEQNGKYAGTYNIGENSEQGNYKADYIQVQDGTGRNIKIYNSENNNLAGYTLDNLSGSDFQVTASAADTEAPKLNSITVDKQTAAVGETVTITADVTDNSSGVGTVNVEYILPSGTNKYIDLTEQNGKYVGTLKIGQYDESGSYKFNRIYFSDNAGNNYAVWNSEINSESTGTLQNFTSLDIQVTGTTPDTEAPKLNSITVDKQTATVGDTVTITVDASDDVSGIEAGSIEYKLPSGLTKYAGLSLVNGKLVGTLDIGQYDESGSWKVDSVSLIDKLSNWASVYNSEVYTESDETLLNLSAGDFDVTGTTLDTEAPKLNSIAVDKITVSGGDKVTVTVDAQDDASGIKSGVIYYTPPSGDDKYAQLTLLNGKLVGTIDIGNYDESGSWKVNYIKITDKSGKSAYVYNSELNSESYKTIQNLSAGDFAVTGTTPDLEAPAFNSITVDKASAVPGDKVTITVDASDDVSGIRYGSINYTLPSGASKYVGLGLVNGKLVGTLNIGQYDESGSWKVNEICISDGYGRSTYVYNSETNTQSYGTLLNLSAGDIDVTGTTLDAEAPKLNGITVDKTSAAAGDKVTITVDASDDASGIEYGGINYVLPSGLTTGAGLSLVNGKLVGTFDIGQYDESGSWKVYSVYITDKSGKSVSVLNSELNSESYQTIQDLSAGDFTVTGTTPDIEPPTFNSLTVDMPSATAGDKVTVTIDASDDVSGIQSGSISYKLPSGSGKDAELSLVNGKLVGTIDVGQYDKSGSWKVDQIIIIDKTGKYIELYNSEIDTEYPGGDPQDLSAGDFDVTGTTPDLEAPKLNSITVDRQTAGIGDTVTISADVTDDASGIMDINVNYRLPSGENKYIDLTEQNGKYVGTFKIDQYDESGSYKFDWIYFSDNVLNNTVIFNSEVNSDNYQTLKDFTSLDVEVTGTTPDTEAPKLNSVTVDKTSASSGDKVTVTVDVQDDVSGIESGSMYYKLPSGASKYVNLSLVNGKLVGTIDISQYDESGNWKVNEIDVSDKSGKGITVYNSAINTQGSIGTLQDLSAGDFEVTGTTPDLEAPKLNGITIDKTTAAVGEILTITADITDDVSGINYVGVNYLLPSGQADYVPLFEQNGKYVGTVNIKQYDESGSWKFNNIEIGDNSEKMTNLFNSEIYSDFDNLQDFSNMDFVVSGTTPDLEAPKLNSVTVDNTSAAAGDKVTVTVDAQDDVSGLQSGKIFYKLPSGDIKNVDLNPVNGKFVGIIDIGQYDESGSWKVNEVDLTDKSGKFMYLFNSEINIAVDPSQDLSAGDFEVTGTTPDSEAPKLNGITIDKTIAAVGDTVTITADVTDNVSGIRNINVEYKLPSGNSKFIDLTEQNGKYVGTFDVGQYDESGSYKFNNIYFSDNAGNDDAIWNSEINSDDWYTLQNFAYLDVAVTGGTTVDLEVPKLNSITIDKTTAAVGDTVTITADATDDVSGVNYVYLMYKLPSGAEKCIDLTENAGKYVGTIEIGQYSESGTWKFDFIQINDNSGKWINIYNSEIYGNMEGTSQDFSYMDFDVSGTTPDTEAPKLNSITVDKASATVGDTVKITADITDDLSGINYANLDYQLPSGAGKSVSLTEKDGKYVGTIEIGQYDEPGIWKFNGIYIGDNAENYTDIYNNEINSEEWMTLQNLSAYDFQVTGTTPDTEAPVINNISTDKSSYTTGDNITLTVDATDSISGVDGISINYKNIVNGEYKTFFLNLINGKYEIWNNIISVLDSPGDWKVDSIDIYDKAGNYTTYYNSELYTKVDYGTIKNLSTGDFSIYGTVGDVIPPVFNSITVDKKDAVEGDSVKVTVDAKDNESAISYISAVYKLENGEEKTVNLSYCNGVFVGWIDLSNCSGLAKLNCIQIVDKGDNCDYFTDKDNTYFNGYPNAYVTDLTGGDINVSPSSAEKDMPVFNSVTADKNTASLGDKVKVTISAEDTGSGIQKADIYYTSSNGQSKEITAKPNGNLLEGYFYVNKYDDSSWKIGNINIYDNAGNVLELDSSTADFTNADLTISGTTPDYTSPEIKDLFVEYKEIAEGQTQKIYIDASDDISGIKSIKAQFNYGDGEFEVTDFTYDNGKYAASFNPADYTYRTDFWLDSITVIDNNGNESSAGYDGGDYGDSIDLTKGDFHYTDTYTSNFADTPIFKGISIDKQSVLAGEEVTFTVDAEQTTNPISYSYIKVMSPVGKQETVPLQLINGKYVGKLKIMDYFDTGVWKINSVTLSDEYMNTLVVGNGFIDYTNDSIWGRYISCNNFQTYFADLRNCNFTVAETTSDNTAPVLNSISISKNTAAFGDKVKITVNASDDLSGIKLVDLEYRSNINDYSYLYVKLNKIGDNQFEGYLDLSGIYKDTPLMLNEIYIVDNNGNVNCIYNNKNELLDIYEYQTPKTTINKQDLSSCDVSAYSENELYDLNSDGELSVLDIAKAANEYNAKKSDSNWNDVMFDDVNGDNVINLYDLVLLSKKII